MAAVNHAPVLRRCGGEPCTDCDKEKGELRRDALGAGPALAPPAVHDVLGSAGSPLDAGVRAFMEPRFGQDLSGVRVHSDAQAAASAGAVHARAYTVGSHIAFASGAYSPTTTTGLRLLAHELTHTIQQQGHAGGTLAPQLEVGAVDDPAEHEADRIADYVMATPASGVSAEGPTAGAKSAPTVGVSTISGAGIAPASVVRAGDSLARMPALTVQRDQETAPPPQAVNDAPSAADPGTSSALGAQADPAGAVGTQADPAAGATGTCPPGYTICDFLNDHISVDGQYALYRLYQRGGAACHRAIQILSAVRSGQVQGVYKADEGKPAMLAQQNGTNWWSMQDHPSAVPKGGSAFMFEGASPPMLVFKKEIAADRDGLASALDKAWTASAIGATELNPSPPTGKSCEPAKKEEPPPPPKPEPEPERQCLPGTVPAPGNPDICIPEKEMTLVPPCTDSQMSDAFQSAQDECAGLKSSIDMLCGLGKSPCDLIPGKIGGAICNIADPDEAKSKVCNQSRPEFYAECTINNIKGKKPTMKCDPGSPAEVFEKYKKWPGHIK